MLTVPEEGFITDRRFALCLGDNPAHGWSAIAASVLTGMSGTEIPLSDSRYSGEAESRPAFLRTLRQPTIVARNWLQLAMQAIRLDRLARTAPLCVRYANNLSSLRGSDCLTGFGCVPGDADPADVMPNAGRMWGEVWVWPGLLASMPEKTRDSVLGLGLARAFLIAIWHLAPMVSLYLDPEAFGLRDNDLLRREPELEYGAFEQQILAYRSDEERSAMRRFWPEDLVDVWLQAYDQPDIAARVDAAIQEFGREPDPDAQG